MPTADNVKARLQTLIDTANDTTGASDTTISDAMASLIGGYGNSGGGDSGCVDHLLSDEDIVKCGTFTPASDIISGYTFDHGEATEPYMISVWTKNPQFADRYKIGGTYCKTDAMIKAFSSFSALSVNAGISISVGASGEAYRIYPSNDAQIFVGSSGVYPLKAGIEYRWEARWLK